MKNNMAVQKLQKKRIGTLIIYNIMLNFSTKLLVLSKPEN